MINIAAIEHYLPEKRLTNNDLEREFPEWNAAKINEKIGIDVRHVAGESETSLDLAYEACRKLFENYDRSRIDFILFCTQSPDYFLPTTACILQEKLQLPTSTGALDFNLGCSGFVYGLALAKGLISIGMAKNVLLVTADTYSKFLDPADKSNRSIFGDAAAATIVEKDGTKIDFQFSVGTDGGGSENLIVKNGASRNGHTEDATLFMNGPEIFNFTIGNIPGLIKDTLEKNNLSMEDIDLFVFHQANSYMLNYLRKKCRIPEDKFVIDMKNSGNTVSSTIPIALQSALENGKIRFGSKVLIAGFGVGYSWAAGIVEF